MTDQKKSSPDQKDPSPALDAFVEQHLERRDDLALRRLRGEALAAGEEAELSDLNEVLARLLPQSAPMPPYVTMAMAEVERLSAQTRPALDAERRRRMREAAERTRFRSDQSGQLGGMLSHCLDALEQAERERDALREKLAAAERKVEALMPPRETLKPLAWADVLAAEARVDEFRARGVTGDELTKAVTSMRIAKAAWGLDEHERAAR